MNYAKLERIFTQAKNFIGTPRTWSQGGGWGVNGSRCAVRALIAASTTEIIYKYACKIFCEVNSISPVMVGWPWETPYISAIPLWNDAPQRTHAQVMAAFDEAIAYCQVQQEPKFVETKPVAQQEKANVSLV